MSNNINTACCFTGHRDIPTAEIDTLSKALDYEIERHFTEYGVTDFISGGAIGFDLLAAEAVIRAKKQHPSIRLILALPCANHSRGWSAQNISKLNFALAHSDDTVCLSEHYYRGCMHNRNRYMLNNSAYCISYCTKDTGGTFYTLSLAKKSNKIITEL